MSEGMGSPKGGGAAGAHGRGEGVAPSEGARALRRFAERDLRYAFACATDVLTHDLKNLVGAALMSLRAFSTRQGATSDDGAEFFDDALRTLEQSVETLDRLRGPLGPFAGGGPTSVADAAREAAALLEPAWPKATAAVRVELEPGLVVPVDRYALTHLFVHLFERAASAFARSGRPGTIVVAAAESPEGWPPGSVSFVVRDDGPVLPGEVPPHDPFDPFDRFDPTNRPDFGRERIALAMVKHLVETAGGEVQLAREGGATQVRCHVPPPDPEALPRLTRL